MFEINYLLTYMAIDFTFIHWFSFFQVTFFISEQTELLQHILRLYLFISHFFLLEYTDRPTPQ